MRTKLVVIVGLLLFCASATLAQGKAEPNRVRFSFGKSNATLSGTLSKNEQIEYVFGAKAGQAVTLKVTSAPKGNLFDFTVAGADDIVLETEYDSYSDYTFTAPASGDYVVSVRKNRWKKLRRRNFF